jgi:hypothetical protein
LKREAEAFDLSLKPMLKLKLALKPAAGEVNF